jgi:hypothetical protein
MTFELLPISVTRWQSATMLIAMIGGSIRAVYFIWQGSLWDVIFSAAMALAAAFGWWYVRCRPPTFLHLDELELRLGSDSASATIIPWSRIERMQEDSKSMAIYYRDKNEPRLLDLQSSTFRPEDWDQIRPFILLKNQGEQDVHGNTH